MADHARQLGHRTACGALCCLVLPLCHQGGVGRISGEAVRGVWTFAPCRALDTPPKSPSPLKAHHGVIGEIGRMAMSSSDETYTTPEGADAAASPPPAPQRRIRRDKANLTRAERAEAQDTFLTTFAECGILKEAARAAGISRQIVYEWNEHDPAFKARFALAEADANDVIRGEIRRRGVQGVDEPVYQGGELVGTIRRYSDAMLKLLAASRMPEFRDKLDVTSGDQPIGPQAFYANILNDPTATAQLCDLLTRVAGRHDAGAGRDPGRAGADRQ